LQKKLGEKGHQSQQNISQSLQKSIKRKHMNAFEKQINDKRRLEAIAAYRKMKKTMLEDTS
jgi:hypothetical protein